MMSKITKILFTHGLRTAKILADGPIIVDGKDIIDLPELVDHTETDILRAQWTKVEDGLPEKPEEDAEILLADEHGCIVWCYYHVGEFWSNGTEMTDHDDFCQMVKDEFTHYQPIAPPHE